MNKTTNKNFPNLPKLLVLTSTFPRWKNDTEPPFVYELSKRLTKDFDVFVLAPHYKEAKKFEIMNNIKVYRFKYFFEKWEKLTYSGGIPANLKKNKFLYLLVPLFLISEFFSLIKLVNTVEPNIIHAHWVIPQGIITYLNYKIHKTPYILTSHGSDIFTFKWLNFFKKLIIRDAKTITVVSSKLKEEIVKNIDNSSENKIIILSMGVDKKLFNPKKYSKEIKNKYNIKGPLLLFVGRLSSEKGVKYLIKALPDITKRFPKIKLLIIGDGTLRSELEKLAERLKVKRNTIFLGAIPHHKLPQFYSTADIFIGPSLREGFGLTFAEAAFSGCIPIGTKVGGIVDIIQDEKTGFLVKEESSEDISNTVIKLLSNKNLMEKIKKQTRKEAVKRFGWDETSERYKNHLSF